MTTFFYIAIIYDSAYLYLCLLFSIAKLRAFNKLLIKVKN